ncbi:MAG: hypothetical protein ACPIOQ_30215, partial [Promethearchaeia archaeon]
ACVRLCVAARSVMKVHTSARADWFPCQRLPAWAAWIAHALTAESLLSGQVAEGMCLTVVGPDQVEVKGAAGGVTLVISQLKA